MTRRKMEVFQKERGLLSQERTGELLMLIEADKRGNKNSLALAYSTSDHEQFYVPANVFSSGNDEYRRQDLSTR